MIVKMSRYDFVLFAAQSDDFIARLRGLGLVDITTSGWEPAEQDRQLLTDIDHYRKAADYLRAFAESESMDPAAAPYASGAEAYEAYADAQQRKAWLSGEIARLEKLSDELRPWGEFSADAHASLTSRGVVLRYFVAQTSTFEASEAEWRERYTLEEIARTASSVYFVVVTAGDGDVTIDAQEIKAPDRDYRAVAAEAADDRAQLKALDAEFSRCAASVGAVEAEYAALAHRLQNVKIRGTAAEAADGTLVVMEGWAEKDMSAEVDALLDEYPNVVYLKSDPTPEDNTPVKLKNNRFARLFELVGSLYALPKYGTLDLTPFFAPFYMLFFAICLNDAGYGLILLLAGLFLVRKGGDSLKRAGWLTVVCGGATVLFGFYTGSFFGLSIPEMLGYPDIAHSPFLDFQQKFFSYALALGVFQILLGMLINVCMTTHIFGFRYALGTLGWFLLILSCCIASGLQMLNEAWTIPFFTMGSPAFLAVAGVALVLMLFFNSPGKNIFMNFGSGLWNTYNNITGLLSDVLSYIRLFAIGLSGGVLALVFNSLALGITGLDGDLSASPWWAVALQIVGASIILLIGHGINLFMSTISSLVHPMRLTFVEFYKNAGFEMTTRSFQPLTDETNK